jgi:hypothetical protein
MDFLIYSELDSGTTVRSREAFELQMRRRQFTTDGGENIWALIESEATIESVGSLVRAAAAEAGVILARTLVMPERHDLKRSVEADPENLGTPG